MLKSMWLGAAVCLGMLMVASQGVAEETHGPAVGDVAPAVEAKDLAGGDVSLKALREKQPVVVVFLRGFPGYQCPLCTKQVAEFLAAADKLKSAGAHVLMIYPGPAEKVKEKAAEFVKGKALPEHFDLVIDPDYVVTNAWKLRWDAHNETAYPSTFIVDVAGNIRFAKVSTGHGGRSSAAEVLKTLETLK